MTGTRPADFRDGRTHHLTDLGRSQREELTGAARGEQSRRFVLQQPRAMFPIGTRIEAIVGIEMRDRERQQAARDASGHVGRFHCHGRTQLSVNRSPNRLIRVRRFC